MLQLFQLPHSFLQVFTTESFLHLSIPQSDTTSPKGKLWEIEPFTSKFVINFSFQSATAGIFVGFLHLKTTNHSIILPTEIRVIEGRLILPVLRYYFFSF